MPIVAVKDWSFETMDYNKYHHVINQERINWFAINYNFSSEYIIPLDRNLLLTTFSKKKLTLNGIVVNAILVFHTVSTKCPYYLEIFPDEEKHWKAFVMLFDIFISEDIMGNEVLKQLSPFINSIK